MSVKSTPRSSRSDMMADSVYSLPPMIGSDGHDPRKLRAPAYSFGARILQSVDEGPGPAYYVDSKVTKFGKERDRGPMINSRPSPRPIENFTPGPVYRTEVLGSPRHKRSPSYSFGRRSFPNFDGPHPGPTAYQIPTAIGPGSVKYRGAPAIALKGREQNFGFSHDYAKTPGPAAYGVADTKSPRRPLFSLTGRHFLPGYKMVTPGPGTYSSDNILADKKRGPKYSIGVRHSDKALPFFTLADVSE